MSTLRRLDCDAVRDLAPLYVLGALDASEAAAVREHLATCTQLHAEIAELGSVVGYLAELPEPIEPSAAVEGRLMAAVEADLRARQRDETAAARLVGTYETAAGGTPAGAGSAASDTAAIGPHPPTSLAEARARRRLQGRGRLLLEAAAAVALVATVGWNVLLQGQVGEARRGAELLGHALAAASQPGSVLATITGTVQAPNAAGFVVLSKNGEAYVVLSGLPRAPAGKTYQAWFISGSVATSAGTFDVGPDGLAIAGVIPAAGSSATAFGITVEQTGGADQPSMAPIALATLRS